MTPNARPTSPRAASRQRDAGLANMRRVTRWVVAGSIALVGVVTAAVAQALPGRSASATAPRSATPARPTSPASPTTQPTTPGLQAPAQAPSSTPSDTSPTYTAPTDTVPPAPAPVVSGGS